ncbi:hypothetical protein FVA95_03725 [Pseudonocardia sp. EV170527-09]|uniref:hypothetical protein n=1 Tax=Pseudonocardia sp. EV170527-09 TaxID=2603411 RepID=UPI0011F2DA3E|nr:hypothetical protein [Pseudonocardia sp. EV170527-09]KAA1034598.1 hypothetical protein FVA95_03725 [Pseudonocardia sp. EV170527-09]
MGTINTTDLIGTTLSVPAPVCVPEQTVVAHDVAHAGIAVTAESGVRRRQQGVALLAPSTLRSTGEVYPQGGMPVAVAGPIFDDKCTAAFVPGRRGGT